MNPQEKEQIYKDIYAKVKDNKAVDKESLGYPEKKQHYTFYFTVNRVKVTWLLNAKSDRFKISCEINTTSHSEEENRQEGANQKERHPEIFYSCFGENSITYSRSLMLKGEDSAEKIETATNDFITFVVEASTYTKSRSVTLDEKQPELEQDQQKQETKEKEVEEGESKAVTIDNMEPAEELEDDLQSEIEALFSDVGTNTGNLDHKKEEKQKNNPESINKTVQTIEVIAEDNELYHDFEKAMEIKKRHLDNKEKSLQEQEAAMSIERKDLNDLAEQIRKKEAVLAGEKMDYEKANQELSKKWEDFKEKEKEYMKQLSEHLESAEALKRREEEVIVKEKQLQDRSVALDEREKIINRRDDDATKKMTELAQREVTVIEKEKNINLLKNLIGTEKQNIQYAQEELDRREAKVSVMEKSAGVDNDSLKKLETLKQTITDKDQEILACKEKIDACKEKMLEFNNKYKLMAQKCKAAESRENEPVEITEEMKKTMQDKDEQIKRLTEEKEQLKKQLESIESNVVSSLESNEKQTKLEAELKEKDDKITELNNRVIELERDADHNKMILSIKEQLENKDIPCEVIPSEGPVVLKVCQDGCDIYINEEEKVIIAEKLTKNAGKYKKTVNQFNQEDQRGLYSIDGKKIVVKKFMMNAVDDVLAVAEKLRNLQ